jgi:hypothetical protein
VGAGGGSSGAHTAATPAAASSGNRGPAVAWQLLISATAPPQGPSFTALVTPRAQGSPPRVVTVAVTNPTAPVVQDPAASSRPPSRPPHPLPVGPSSAAAPLGHAPAPAVSGGGGFKSVLQLSGGPPNPTARNQTVVTKEDTAVSIYWLTYGDTDPNGYTVTLQSITQPGHGTAVLNANGTVTYTPALHWSGADSFTYTISNGNGGTATANVAVTVQPVHYPPVASAVSVSTTENTAVGVTLSATDLYTTNLTCEIATGPSHGTLSALNGNTITYVPNGDFTGADTFTYDANDGDVTSAPATVTVTVNAVTLSPGVTVTQAGGSTNITEPGGVMVDGEDTSNQAATYTVVLNTAPAANVVVAVNYTGAELTVSPTALTFTPSNWSTPQTVTIQGVDDTIVEAAQHTVTITHAVSSTDPVYNGIRAPSVPVTITESDVVGLFADVGSTSITLNEVGPTSANVGLALDSRPAANVTVTLTPDSYETLSARTFTFTPANWNTEQTVTVTAVHDGIAEGYHTGTINMTAASSDPTYQGMTSSLSVNILDADGPNALPVSAEGNENAATTFNPLANDSDPSGYTLTVTSVTQPAHGTVVINSNSTLTYTPAANWSGADSFSYTISNGHGGTASGTVTAQVDAVDLPPVVTNPGSQTSATDTSVSLQIQATSANDSSSTAFLYSASNLPPGLVIDPMTGNIWGWIDPAAWKQGSYAVSVTVDDQNGGVTTVNFSWTATMTDHAPYVNQWTDGYAFYDEPVDSLSLSPFSGEDVDGNALTFSVAGLPPGVSYDPTTNSWSGTVYGGGNYLVTVTASDGYGGTAQMQFWWEVVPSGQYLGPQAAVFLASAAALANTGATVAGSIDMEAFNHYNTYHTVTLQVEPAGRATVSPASFSLEALRGGTGASFTLTPTAVSQSYGDIVVTASVDGAETGRTAFTNVGVVLPQTDIKGEDTPDGMADRVSIGAGNWGTYYGTMQVYPNLMGFDVLSLSIQSPNNDPKYGQAAASDPELPVLTNSVVTVDGTQETEPSPDGQGDYAGFLQLVAQVGNGQIAKPKGFAAANKVTVITATLATPVNGGKITVNGNQYWFFGVDYNMEAKADGGDLTGLFIGEEIKYPVATGVFAGAQAIIGSWVPASSGLVDYNGLALDAGNTLDASRRALRKELQAQGGTQTTIQSVRWYSEALGKPARYTDAAFVDFSKFQIKDLVSGRRPPPWDILEGV